MTKLISPKVEEVHISQIQSGDTILHDGDFRTLTDSYIKTGFCGRSIWGDSYRAGTVKVKRVVFKDF